MYFTDERPAEPLCWEEQLNSRQVKLLKQRKTTMDPDHHYKEIDSHPVVFHQKNSVEEILKKQKMRFHLTSCQLPKLQSNENTKKANYNPQVKYLSTGKQAVKNKKSSFNDRIELKGSGIQSSYYNKNKLENCTGKLPKEQNYFHKEMYGQYELCLQDRDTRVQSNGSIDISPENNLPTLDNTSCAQKQYVDIPVSVPNPALTDESCSIVSEARDLNSEIISFDKTEQWQCNKELPEKKASEELPELAELPEEKASEELPELAELPEEKASGNEIQHSSDATEDDRSKSVSKIIVPVETPCINDFETSFRKSSTAIGHARFHKPARELSREGRTSSRLTYTPSNPPLFLSDEILELPKGVPPNKALVELRQTFCENMRRETEQLEFDLQELYLKKQLHQR